jgi:hypothetical protein
VICIICVFSKKFKRLMFKQIYKVH